jgi:hypothetical protein
MNQPDSHSDLLELAIRESLAGRLASTAGTAASSAWASSATRQTLRSAALKWQAVTPPTRIRLISLTGAVAVVVHRAMALLGPREPLGAVLPAIVLVSCGLMAALAGPMAQALERIKR